MLLLIRPTERTAKTHHGNGKHLYSFFDNCRGGGESQGPICVLGLWYVVNPAVKLC
jgi:hypothetical protein